MLRNGYSFTREPDLGISKRAELSWTAWLTSSDPGRSVQNVLPVSKLGSAGLGRRTYRFRSMPVLPLVTLVCVVAVVGTASVVGGAFAKELKSQGYRFVGPTSVYAFMQNVGVINDHIHGCFRATDYRATARRR